MSKVRSSELTLEEKATNNETWKHIHQVQTLMTVLIQKLMQRSLDHDASKLELPEVQVFTEFTPKLASCTYGSEEYKQFRNEMKEGALDHHYINNSHHPEHFDKGIDDMTLIDVIEMLVDWKAATLRHDDGDILKSLEINKERFGISDQLLQILKNTVRVFDVE